MSAYLTTTKNASKNQDLTSLVRAVVYERSASEDAHEDPALYTYIRVVHNILKHRDALPMVTLRGESLANFIYDSWMQDVKPSRCADLLAVGSKAQSLCASYK